MFRPTSRPVVLCALALALLLSPPLLASQQPAATPSPQATWYTYVSQWAVPRAQWAAFERQEASSAPAMQRYVADGTLVAWGNAETWVHEADGYTHVDFFIAHSRADILKVLSSLWTTASNPAYDTVTRHSDLFMTTVFHAGKTSAVTTGYIRTVDWKVKPGRSDAFEATFKRYFKPMLDADVANGTLLMYNFDHQDIHTSAPGWYTLALMFPSGGAIDHFFAEYEARSKQDPAPGEYMDTLTVSQKHRDWFGKLTACQHR